VLSDVPRSARPVANVWRRSCKRHESPYGSLAHSTALSRWAGEMIVWGPPNVTVPVKALSDSPAVLDLFMWLSYRCFIAKRDENIPLFRPFGLAAQIGSAEYARPRRFREILQKWLNTVRLLWPNCPARIDSGGQSLRIGRAVAILSNRSTSE